MTAVEILGRLNDLGVSVRVNGNKVRVAPVSAVPGELLAEAGTQARVDRRADCDVRRRTVATA